MNTPLIILIPLILLSSAGCNKADKQVAAGSKEHAVEPADSSRPETIASEIAIEGVAEVLEMNLLESPEEFPLDFSTYIPADMQESTLPLDEGYAIRIWAVFGGVPNKEAHLTIYVFPSAVGAEEAREASVGRMKRLGDVVEDTIRHPWARGSYSLKGNKTGFLALARAKGHWFYLMTAYPPEYADGMGPRIDQIIERWRWKDDGKSLKEK